MPASLTNMSARPEFWCYDMNGSNSTQSLAGFTEAVQHMQMLNGSHTGQALLFPWDTSGKIYWKQRPSLGFEISHCAICLPTQTLVSTGNWSLLLHLWLVIRCPPCLHLIGRDTLVCSSSARGSPQSPLCPLSPQHPPKALQGRGEEEPCGHTWGLCPGAGCACTKPMSNMRWCLLWPIGHLER